MSPAHRTVAPTTTPLIQLGRRAQGKSDKLARIRSVAHRLFAAQGFANTTTKQIATEAGIGAGTLFLYAPSKEDLLVLIFQDEVGHAVDDAFATIPRAPLLDQILHVFSAIAAHHESDRSLARVFVKELPFVEDSRHGVDHFMNAMIGRLSVLIEAAKSRGEIASDLRSELLAQNLFAIFFQRMQMWLIGRLPDWGSGDSTLADALALQLRGARPFAMDAVPSTRTRTRTTRKSP